MSMRQENHHPSFDSGRVIRAFEKNVPECYVRDYRSNGSWLAVCRGYKPVTDDTLWEKGRPNTIPAPRECLCFIPKGTVTATTWWQGTKLIRPGWRNQFRLAKKYLTDAQKRRIEKDLHYPVFKDL